MSGDFTPEQKRYLEGFSVRPADRARRAPAARRAAPEPAGPDAEHIAAQDRVARGRRQALRAGEVQARAASVRRLCPPEGAGREERVSQARRQFPLALLRPVLRRAGAELLHVPAADPERHPQALAARGPGRPRRDATAAAIRTSRPAPTSRSARSSRRTRSRCSRRSRTSACARAAPAPTTSATSPARRPPASIRRS